jgi:hypothetical protein
VEHPQVFLPFKYNIYCVESGGITDAQGYMKEMSELQGRLAEVDEWERAIAAGHFGSLEELQIALQSRIAGVQSDLHARAAVNRMLVPALSLDSIEPLPFLLH